MRAGSSEETYWSEFNAAAGDPDPAHPYTPSFVYNGTSGIDGKGPYVDKFPYRAESLPTSYAPYSVSALEPLAGAVLAEGTKKTVRWIARGCVLVDIYYGSGAGTALIAGKYPNVGYYFWTVPNVTLPVRTDYFVRIVCLTSQGAPTGPSDDTAQFSLTNSDLVLLNPGRAFRAVNGGTIRVAWKKSGAVSGVNVFVRAASGSESQVATNAQGTFVDVTLPGAVSNSRSDHGPDSGSGE